MGSSLFSLLLALLSPLLLLLLQPTHAADNLTWKCPLDSVEEIRRVEVFCGQMAPLSLAFHCFTVVHTTTTSALLELMGEIDESNPSMVITSHVTCSVLKTTLDIPQLLPPQYKKYGLMDRLPGYISQVYLGDLFVYKRHRDTYKVVAEIQPPKRGSSSSPLPNRWPGLKTWCEMYLKAYPFYRVTTTNCQKFATLLSNRLADRHDYRKQKLSFCASPLEQLIFAGVKSVAFSMRHSAKAKEQNAAVAEVKRDTRQDDQVNREEQIKNVVTLNLGDIDVCYNDPDDAKAEPNHNAKSSRALQPNAADIPRIHSHTTPRIHSQDNVVNARGGHRLQKQEAQRRF